VRPPLARLERFGLGSPLLPTRNTLVGPEDDAAIDEIYVPIELAGDIGLVR
jgi:hypothetical protein